MLEIYSTLYCAIMKGYLFAAFIPASSSTKCKTIAPITININTMATPYRCDPYICVKYPSKKGPKNDVAFPEKAKNPKNSFTLSRGTRRAMRERLEA